MLVNPFPNKPWFSSVYSDSLLKTLREKEKLLVTSNFSFSYSVFNPFGKLPTIFIKFTVVVCRVFQFGRNQNLSFGKGLNNSFSFSHNVFKTFFFLGSLKVRFIWWTVKKSKEKYWHLQYTQCQLCYCYCMLTQLYFVWLWYIWNLRANFNPQFWIWFSFVDWISTPF